MVFRRRSQSQKRPIHSIKHVIDQQDGIVGAAAPTLIDLILAVDAPVVTNTAEVETRARVNSFFLNVQVTASSTTTLANLYFYIFSNPGSNIVGTTFPNGNVVGASDHKPLIFHQEMIMTEKNTTAIARTMFKGVISIPRHMRSMALNDRIQISFFSPGVNFDVCVQCIYKEYR